MRKTKVSKNIMKSGGNIPVAATLIILASFIVGLLVGTTAVAGFFKTDKGFLFSPMTGSFADGYNAAKKKLADSGFFPRQGGTLSGRITKISGNEVTFTAPLANPLDDDSFKIRTAVIGKDTVITVYRVKSSEQIVKDASEGREEMAEFQNQADSLRSLMSKCLPAGPAPVADNSDSDCQKISKDYADVLQKINQAGQKADMFEKIDKASAGDLKAGMQITVYGREIKQVENQAAPVVAITGNFEDISEKLKFETSRIEAREAPVSPVAMPAPVTR